MKNRKKKEGTRSRWDFQRLKNAYANFSTTNKPQSLDMSDQNKLSLRKPRTGLGVLYFPQKNLDWKWQKYIPMYTTYNTVGPHIVHITVTRKKFWIQWYESYHAQNSSKSSEKLHLFFYLPTLLQRLHYVRTWCTLQRYIWDINFLWLMHKYFSKLTDFYHINDVIDYNVFETLF